MKSVFGMCSSSQFAFPGPTFSGPFRPEVTVQALIGIMTQPRLTAEQLAEDPRRGECFGSPRVLHPDNEKALLPPAMIPNLVSIVPVLELPKAYHSDAKAKHERFHRFLKGCLHRLKGRVLGPGTLSDPRHDPLVSADVTRQQFAAMVEIVRIAWNERPKKSLGWRSPMQVLVEQLRTTGRSSMPPEEIQRHLARTVSVVLTTNGVEFDHVRYRFNKQGIEAALGANVRRQPFAKRLADTGRCVLTARVWDSDLDHIDVYDPETREYHRLYCADAVDAVAARAADAVSIGSAQRSLGLPVYALEQLFDAGLLQRVNDPTLRILLRRPMTVASALERLQVRLAAAASKRRMPMDALPIGQESRRIGGGPKPWDKIYAAMLAGEVPFWIDGGPHVDHVLVELGSLDRFMGLPLSKRTKLAASCAAEIDTNDAAEMLNVIPATIRRLRVEGILSDRAGPRARLSRRDEVEALAREYISAAELARLARTSAVRVNVVLTDAKVDRLVEGVWSRAGAFEAMSTNGMTTVTKRSPDAARTRGHHPVRIDGIAGIRSPERIRA